jgi:hypothetical protein
MIISLESLLEAHLSQLQGLWQRVAPVHAGLDGLSALSWELYSEKLPPAGQFFGFGNFHPAPVVIPASMDWISANAARDLLSLLLMFLESIRCYFETADVERLKLTEQERQSLLQERLKRPPSPQDAINRLNSVLLGGFPVQQELLTMEYVAKLFMARVAKQELAGSVSLTLCSLEEAPVKNHEGSLSSVVGRVTFTVSSLSDLEPTAELLHRVFLTAGVIMRDLEKAVQLTLGQVQSTP